ncbi:MAG: exodeoxyribonuclease VII small subunit [Atopobiaceae bacterium]|jgi:exodeoxyribonuclease VII small subunit|nr:exodeoxyribonuclease VII small subunit [Atopobiaceae bacterium]MCI2173087.1 exodeoxyribonuclease VII small subunit [Atopobiaceae bacterium]MCI2208180.1 exodeoxyribonuclease VII small subunit [Atopobiaceae bacterium]
MPGEKNTSTNDERPVEELTFKEASIELEQIVRSLETGDLELEESLKRYGRGVELLRNLRERLSSAEQKVQVLIDTTDSGVTDTQSAPSTAFIDD